MNDNKDLVSIIDYISYNSQVQTLVNYACNTVGIEFAKRNNITGKGVTVATIDTGIAPHKDLIYPNNKIIGFKDFIHHKAHCYDDNGHGTHTGGLICSSGYCSEGKYCGIAPDSKIVAVKALDENGNGRVPDVLEAIQWIVDNKKYFNAKILNLSLGTSPIYPERSDPLVAAANYAIDNGFIVICAVGNSGPYKRSILSPANGRNIISVGACNDKLGEEYGYLTIPKFSSRGPTRDRIPKPDLVAPGVNITSLSNENLSGYISLTGTSMAAPLVAGIVALLLEKKPNLNHFQVKRILMNSCVRINGKRLEEGAGMIRIDRLLKNVAN